jgi:hypothetical protein
MRHGYFVFASNVDGQFQRAGFAPGRHFCEEASGDDDTLIRINPRETSVPDGQIGIAAGALETLQAIDNKLVELCGNPARDAPAARIADDIG